MKQSADIPSWFKRSENNRWRELIIFLLLFLLLFISARFIFDAVSGIGGGSGSSKQSQDRSSSFSSSMTEFRDFDDYLNLAEELQPKTNLVMIVECDHPSYFRRRTLSGVNEYGCFYEPDADDSLQPFEMYEALWTNSNPVDYAYREELVQNYYYFGGFNPKATMAVNEPERIHRLIVPPEVSNVKAAYRTTSRESVLWENENFTKPLPDKYSSVHLSEKDLSYYLKVPYNERIAGLSDYIISNYHENYQQLPTNNLYKAAFIEHYLQNNYLYSFIT